MNSKKIGRYEIRGLLGEGGMAVVHRGYDPQFRRNVAIKVLLGRYADDAQLRKRFVREAQTVAALEHPAIVPVYDYGEQAGQPYLVMRYLRGGSLIDQLQQGPLQPMEVARIFDRLAPALDFAHEQGIIHRDLKPANILFDQYGQPYLSDFGIVKFVQRQPQQLTGVGLVMGTPLYMSPEQASGSGLVDRRSDLYALGIILFEMLSGRVPFAADTPIATAMQHLLEPLPDISLLRPGLPSGVQALLQRALAKDPEDRYQTAAAMALDLRSIVDGRPIPLPLPQDIRSEAPPVTPPQMVSVSAGDGKEGGQESRRVPWWAAILVAILAGSCLLLIVAGTVYGVWRSAWAAATPVAEIEPPPDSSSTPTVPATSTSGPVATITPLPLATLPVGDAQQLTDASAQEYQPMLSPDQAILAYFSNQTGIFQIYTQELAGGGARNITDNGAENHHPHFSPDGSRIVFTSNLTGNYEIHSMRPDGSDWRQLTDQPGSDSYPSYSPDGQWIVYMSKRGNDWGIYAMQANGDGDRVVIDSSALEAYPVFQADSRTVVFQSNQDGNHEIYLIDLNGGSPIRLTQHAARDANPFVSPDGNWIVFETNRDGAYEIYAMRPDGSDLRNLTNNPANDQIPSISPDGQWLLFQSDRAGNYDIYRQPFEP